MSYEVRPAKVHGEPTGKHELLENGAVVAVCYSRVEAECLAALLRQITPQQRLDALGSKAA